MQVKKDQIRTKILKTARFEFFSKGFHRTTMRSISRKSSITTSNIYNYFKSKEELFEEIVKPTLSQIMNTLDGLEHLDSANTSDMFDYSFLQKQFDVAIHFIDHHRNDLNLILFKSFGSGIQNLKENFINRYTEIIIKQLVYCKKHGSQSNMEISRFFVHNLCSLYMNIITEIIMHNISLEKMKDYSEEFLTFVFHGVGALIGIDHVG
jgi:AcrR family transcriptional regulator